MELPAETEAELAQCPWCLKQRYRHEAESLRDELDGTIDWDGGPGGSGVFTHGYFEDAATGIATLPVKLAGMDSTLAWSVR